MITPDFSLELWMAKVEWLWNLYKARFIGRYMQECGIKVIPNITWPYTHHDYLREHVLGTLPVGLPMIAMQMQTLSDETKANPTDYINELSIVFETLEPEGALIYASPDGREILKEINTGATRLKVIGTRLEKLSESQKQRTKKLTI